jgi:hypothetical protein
LQPLNDHTLGGGIGDFLVAVNIVQSGFPRYIVSSTVYVNNANGL